VLELLIFIVLLFRSKEKKTIDVYSCGPHPLSLTQGILKNGSIKIYRMHVKTRSENLELCTVWKLGKGTFQDKIV
jgi:hypothetical protein